MHLRSDFVSVLPRLAAIAAAILAFGPGAPSAVAAAGPDGFIPLLTAEGIAGFDRVGGADDTWSVEGNVIRCSGQPNGYFLTRKSYRNFVLRVALRYPRPADLVEENAFPGNSGILLFVTGERKVWPQCVEVQGQNRQLGRTFAIGGAAPVTANDLPEVRQQVRSRVGDWNELEITAIGGAVTAKLNGTVVCTTLAGALREGPIGFQSEGAEIHFRGLAIKELP